MEDCIYKVELDELSAAFEKLPKADKVILSRDLSKRYANGIPDEETFEPSTWCGKKPIVLSPGSEGFVEYLEYTSNAKVQKALKKLAIGGGIAVIAVSVYVLVGRAKGLPLPDFLKKKVAVDVATQATETAATQAAVAVSSISTDALNGGASQGAAVFKAAQMLGDSGAQAAIDASGELTTVGVEALTKSVQEILSEDLMAMGVEKTAAMQMDPSLIADLLKGGSVTDLSTYSTGSLDFAKLLAEQPEKMSALMTKLHSLSSPATVNLFKSFI